MLVHAYAMKVDFRLHLSLEFQTKLSFQRYFQNLEKKIG